MHRGQSQPTKLNDFQQQLFELRAKIEDKPLSSFYNEQNEVAQNQVEPVGKVADFSESLDIQSSDSISDQKVIEHIADQDEAMVEDQLVFTDVDDEQMPDVLTRNSQDKYELEMGMETQKLAIALDPKTSLNDIALGPGIAPMDIDQTVNANVEAREIAENYTEVKTSNIKPEFVQYEDGPGTTRLAQSASPTDETYPKERESKTCSSYSTHETLDKYTPSDVTSMLDHDQIVNETAVEADTTVKCTASENFKKNESEDYNCLRTLSEDAENSSAVETIPQEALLTEADNIVPAKTNYHDTAIGKSNGANDELQHSSLKHGLASGFGQDLQEHVHEDLRIDHTAKPDSPLPMDSKKVMTWSEEKDGMVHAYFNILLNSAVNHSLCS